MNALLAKYSDWFQLEKAFVWLTRFKEYLRLKNQDKVSPESTKKIQGPITVSELRTASADIFRYVQHQVFEAEIKSLKHPRKSMKRLGALRRLDPILEDGLLKVGGRIQNAPIRYAAMHPILLPSKHPVTKLLIQQRHRLLGHV